MSGPRRLPRVTDLLVALGTGAVTTLALIAAPGLLGPGQGPTPSDTAWWATAVALALQTLMLFWARTAPQAVLIGTAVVAALLGGLSPTGIGSLADAAILVAALRAALLVPLPQLRVLLPMSGLLVAVGQAADILGSSASSVPSAIGGGLLQAVAIVGLPTVGVLAVTARREAQRARSGESAAVERERDALVQAAVAQERTAMARELHDIAAHHVSGIALMAAAVDRQIDTDPEEAKRAVRQIRGQSRALLDDLRHLVGLLREDVGRGDAVETVAAVPALVESIRATGRAVELSVRGDGDGVGPLGQLVAYRMVQEALSNAAEHAPRTSCTVDLDGEQADRFVVIVRNGPPAQRPGSAVGAGGFGLLGMRERAALVGGTLDAGPDADGGWTVCLTLPSERTAALPQEDR